MKTKVIKGNNIDILKEYPDNYFDSIVTDPPYGIEFLHKDWDKNTGAIETWEQCFRVLKPGGYILAFSAARTYHNLATNIEGVGFEIRDQLMWLYSSGFPKAQDVGKAIDKRNDVKHDYIDYHTDSKDSRVVSNNGNAKNRHCKECGKQLGTNNIQCSIKDCKVLNPPIQSEWAGWKTALKPAHEPIVMARKPFKGSGVDNVLKWGVGALNIDATRIDYEDINDLKFANKDKKNRYNGAPAFEGSKPQMKDKEEVFASNEKGRFPSNVLGEVEGYQKYFYCPKVSRAERHIGFETKNIPAPFGDVKGCYVDGERFAAKHQEYQQTDNVGNNHPTVKPVALMKYLIKLVSPEGGKVLDPFCGSGSTGMAAVELDYDFTGCELDPDYVNIAETRITAWKNKTDLENNPLPEQWFEEE